MSLSMYVHSRGQSPALKATSVAIGIYEAIDVRVDIHSALLVSCDVVEDQGCLFCCDGPCSVTTSRQNWHDDGMTS